MIIGISGKIGSGKDTVGRLIQEEINPDFKIKKFAYKIKQIVSLITGIPTDDLEKQGVKSSKLGPEWDWIYGPNVTRDVVPPEMRDRARQYTVRELLQRIGTEAMRDQIHTNVWVNALFADYNPLEDHWVITDVRFPNEVDAILQRGGRLIRIERPGVQLIDHPSETALDYYGFKHVIQNDGSIDKLREMVKQFK